MDGVFLMCFLEDSVFAQSTGYVKRENVFVLGLINRLDLHLGS